MALKIGKYELSFKVLFMAIYFVFAFQLFFYIKDLNVLYIISKGVVPALGIISFPFMILVMREKPSYTNVIFAYSMILVVMSAFTSAIHFNQPLLYGLTAQAKIFPFFFFFLTYVILRLLKADIQEITNAIITVGAGATFGYLYVNLFVDPASIFEANYDSQLVYFSFEKGFRFLFDIATGIIVAYYFFRIYLLKKKPAYIIPVLLFIVYHAVYQKQRMELLCFLVILALLVLQKASLPKKVGFIALFVFSFVFLFTQFEYFSVMLDTSSGKSDSLNVRLDTISKATDFLTNNIFNFIFGAGFLNPLLFHTTIQDIYGQNFWPADVGWLGLLFELGFIGVMIFISLYILLFQASAQYRDKDSPLMLLALRDFLLFSIIYSVMALKLVFESGLYMTILAIFVYSNHLLGHKKLVKLRPA